MRCERCQTPIRGATWFCPNCGAPVRDLNVADSVAAANLRRAGPWLVAGALSILALLLLRARSGPEGAPGGAPANVPGEAPAAGPTFPPGSLGARSTDLAATAAAEVTAEVAEAPANLTAEPAAPPPEPGAPTAPAGPEVPLRAGAPLWRIARIDFPPRLDGDLSDWPPAVKNGSSMPLASVVFGPGAWGGAADLSGQAWAGYDERALYLGLAVQDDRVLQLSRGAELYLGDSLELQVDTDLAADWDDPAYGADDWHIGLSPGPPGAPPEAWVWRPAASAGPASIPLAFRGRAGGYDAEIALPWSLFGLAGPPDGPFGLNVSVSDGDQDGAGQDSMVSSSPIRKWDDARTLGTVVLDP